MPILVQYKIIDSFNEYNDYLIHQDDIDVTDEENLIIDLVGGDRDDEEDYRNISVVYAKSIGIKHAEFLMECFIAFPYGGREWLRQLAIKERRE
jgi:hypothetical protein|tara:strand:+ start:251 stop:532 length:282 start_codon:yes stop_codon:yes gene_type:complete